jgi:hypothetical protein
MEPTTSVYMAESPTTTCEDSVKWIATLLNRVGLHRLFCLQFVKSIVQRRFDRLHRMERAYIVLRDMVADYNRYIERHDAYLTKIRVRSYDLHKVTYEDVETTPCFYFVNAK